MGISDVSFDFDFDLELQEDGEAQERARETRNPNNEPTGDFTGRCRKCGSGDLWDDNLTYGCNTCGAIFMG